MTATINASTSSGVIVTSDTSGNLAIQSNGTTIATVSSAGLVMPTGKYMYAPGGVVQVVQGTYTATDSTTSTAYVPSGLSTSITPKFSTSNILVSVCTNGYCPAANLQMNMTIYRNSTNLVAQGQGNLYSAGSSTQAPWSLLYLDSPATTSSTTYTPYFKNTGNAGGTIYFNIPHAGGQPTATIVLMEIAG
jgi:hypothetical protein